MSDSKFTMYKIYKDHVVKYYRSFPEYSFMDRLCGFFVEQGKAFSGSIEEFQKAKYEYYKDSCYEHFQQAKKDGYLRIAGDRFTPTKKLLRLFITHEDLMFDSVEKCFQQHYPALVPMLDRSCNLWQRIKDNSIPDQVIQGIINTYELTGETASLAYQACIALRKVRQLDLLKHQK